MTPLSQVLGTHAGVFFSLVLERLDKGRPEQHQFTGTGEVSQSDSHLSFYVYLIHIYLDMTVVTLDPRVSTIQYSRDPLP